MAVVGITEIKGNPKDLLARYDKAQVKMRERGPAPGLITHTCVELPDGMRIANVWESENQLWAGFNNQQFQDIIRAEFAMEPVKPTVYRVHNQLIFGGAQVR